MSADTASSRQGSLTSEPNDVTAAEPPLVRNLDTLIGALRATQAFDETQLHLVRDRIAALSPPSLMQPADPISSGSSFAGYRLQHRVGEGGHGCVYCAVHLGTGNRVALKLLKATGMTPRFRREMKLVRRIAHPNIVVAYDVGLHRNLPFIAMELLTGPDLCSLVRSQGSVGWQQSLQWMLQAAYALDHAADRGMVHRDVKPGNLVLHRNVQVKVSDFGLAKLAVNRDETEPGKLTVEGRIGGTLRFMAPEQARCFSAADARSDIYGLGATWFYLISGRYLIDGASLQEQVTALLANQATRAVDDLDCPPHVRDVLRGMTAYEPNDRFSSWQDLIHALQQISGNPTAPAVRVLVVEDDRTAMHLTIRMLGRLNRAISIAESDTLQRAVAQLAENSFDLILLDLQLPDSAGVETVRSVRRTAPRTPIIVLTGNQDPAVIGRCVAAGAARVAYKGNIDARQLERLVFVALSQNDQVAASRSSNSLSLTQGRIGSTPKVPINDVS